MTVWKSQLILVGTNHNYAPVEFRERLSIQAQDVPARLKTLISDVSDLREAVVLSTCNRTEVYAVAPPESGVASQLIEAMSSWSHIPISDLKERTYTMQDEEAVRHLIAVASGLDSQVIGEKQVQDQVRDAFNVAKQAGSTGFFMSELFQHALRASIRIRRDCGIEVKGASVSSAAVSFLKKKTADQSLRSILLIGAGKMMTLAAKDLFTSSHAQVWVANRTSQRAEELATRFGGIPIAFNKIPEVLEKVDAVLTCTASTNYIITRELLERTMRKRAGTRLILIDTSVPRNIDPDVANIPDVQLFNLDDLAPLLKGAQDSLRPQLEKSEARIREEAEKSYAYIRAHDANDTLRDLMTLAEEIREKELSRALNKIGKVSEREKKVLDLLTRRIINKLLYEPTTRLKEHMGNGDGEAYEAMLRELFAIGRDNGQ
jgi:glutamyl-tRNA reductase